MGTGTNARNHPQDVGVARLGDRRFVPFLHLCPVGGCSGYLHTRGSLLQTESARHCNLLGRRETLVVARRTSTLARHCRKFARLFKTRGCALHLRYGPKMPNTSGRNFQSCRHLLVYIAVHEVGLRSLFYGFFMESKLHYYLNSRLLSVSNELCFS